jgi:hypothetical protein
VPIGTEGKDRGHGDIDLASWADPGYGRYSGSQVARHLLFRTFPSRIVCFLSAVIPPERRLRGLIDFE